MSSSEESSGASQVSCSETLSGIASKFNSYLKNLRPDALFALLCKSLKELGTLVKELLQICSTNGVVAVELGELEVLLNAALAKGRSYISACQDVAEFGSNDELVEAVRTDLENGSTVELQDMLETMQGFLQDCNQKLGDFEDAYKDATEKTKSKVKGFHKDTESATHSRNKAVTSAVGFTAVGVGGASAALLTPAAVPLGIVVVIVSVRGLAEKVLEGYDAHQLTSVAEQAESCATSLHDHLIQAKQYVDRMASEMTNVCTTLATTKKNLGRSKAILKATVNLLHNRMGVISTSAKESLESLPHTLASIRNRPFSDSTPSDTQADKTEHHTAQSKKLS